MPMKWPAITSTGATKSAICMDEPMAMPRARSILPFMATRTAVECSAALPTMATTTTPMNTLPMPMRVARLAHRVHQELADPAHEARGHHQDGDALPHRPDLAVVLVVEPVAALAREQVLVALQLEEQAGGVGQQQHPRDVEAQGLDVPGVLVLGDVGVDGGDDQRHHRQHHHAAAALRRRCG